MEKFRKWEPVSGIPGTLYTEGLHDDHEGFRILLRSGDPTKEVLRVSFESHLAYRNIDEGDRWRTIGLIPEPGQSSLYIVENSAWIRWFCDESNDIHKSKEIVHYAIYGADDCIDVLAYQEPKVEWL